MVETLMLSEIMVDYVLNQRDQDMSLPITCLRGYQHLPPQGNVSYFVSYDHLHRKEANTFKYQSDGSGRDSYVIIDSGGL